MMENKKFDLGIIIVLLVSFLSRIFLLFLNKNLWWDSAVYIGMGKYIFSAGAYGLWEHIRPLGWPLILGSLWKLGLNPVFFGRLLELFLSLGSVYLVYLISKKIFNPTTGILAALLFSFSPTFFYHGFHLLTEIPATFFSLLAVYFFVNKREVFSAGFFAGFAFLLKFPYGVFLLVIGFSLILFNKGEQLKNQLFLLVKQGFLLVSGFLVITLPFFIFNHIKYASSFYPLKAAQQTIDVVLGCNYFNQQKWYFYFIALPLENFLLVFSVLGLILLFKNFDFKKLALILAFLFPFLYFNQLHCKEIRYAIVFLPYLYIMASQGILYIVEKSFIKRRYKQILTAAFILLCILVFLFFPPIKNHLNEQVRAFYWDFKEPESFAEFYKMPFEKGKTLLTSSPFFAGFSDTKLFPLYLNFNEFSDAEYVGESDYVFINTCDIPCHPENRECITKQEEFITKLNSEFNVVKKKQINNCNLTLFESA